MRYVQLHYAVVVWLIAVFTSCTPPDEEHRFKRVSPLTVKRTILVEDFTGQLCIFCPNAISEIHRLQTAYGKDNIVAVSVHTGNLAISETASGVVGLKTVEGDLYAKKKGIDKLPTLFINGLHRTNSTADFGASVIAALQKESPLSLHLKATYDEAKNTIDVALSVRSSEAVKGVLKMWIVEDDISALQLFPAGKKEENYIHSHVFRATIHSLEGEPIQIVPGQNTTIRHTANRAERWSPQALSVVAFVEAQGEVLQAIQQKVE